MGYTLDTELFKKLADQALEFVFLLDMELQSVVYANSSFKRITGRSFQDYEGNPVTLCELIHTADREYVKVSVEQFMKRRARTLLDFRIILPDGGERWVRLKLSPLRDGDAIRYAAGSLEDDSPRKKSMLNLQKINVWKNSILEILAHDLKGPIGVVQMLSSSIRSQLPGTQHPKIHELASAIEQICQRNIDLIRTLLKKESLETATLEMSRERVDVVWEIEEAISLFREANELLDVRVDFSSSHEKIFAEIDAMKFMQVIHNLLSNSLKFTPAGGFIKVQVEKLEKSLLVSVADNGIGIPRELQPYLFSKYSKARRPGLKGEESTGLGMWIIKSLTELHNGRVWFETEVNKGTIFYVEIPFTAGQGPDSW